MMPPLPLPFRSAAVALGILMCLPSCDKKTAPAAKNTEPAGPTAPRVLSPAPEEALSKKVESVTGARTCAVWSQHQKEKSADPYANGGSQVLMGLDTRDGRGVRVLQKKQGNYARPLLSSDARTILYTRKKVSRDSHGRKHYDLTIHRTDWNGSKAVAISTGYAVDSWRDPKSGIEWVYAVRDIVPSVHIAMEARQVVRFRLDDPAKEEIVWDQTPVSPDNIQLSRDGQRASGQFPWPNAGQFVFDGASSDFAKLQTGCWPGMAPDDSHVSWVLNGEHKAATFFTGDGSKSWSVNLTKAKGIDGWEIYHPRWTNHPRFITLTGPYQGEKVPGEGNTIGKGGTTAEIYIGRFNDRLTAFEDWVRLTENEVGDNYPDVWIEGGDQASLTAGDLGPEQTTKTIKAATSAKWPSNPAGLAFLWENRNKNNTVKLPNGRQLECLFATEGPARYGRFLDLLLDAGSFHAAPEAAAHVAEVTGPGKIFSVEFVLTPESTGVPALQGPVLRLPGLELAFDHGALVANGSLKTTSDKPLPWHVAVSVETGAQATVSINGSKVASGALTPTHATAREPQLVVGGGTSQSGVLQLAVYSRMLADSEIQNHAAMLEHADSFNQAVPRVRLKAKLAETSALPTAEAIDPYTGALVAYVYDVEQVLEGAYAEKRMLVKHWSMLDRQSCEGFPRKIGGSYELLVEPASAHPELTGERTMDDTTAFDLEPWYDVGTPAIRAADASGN